LLIGIHHLKPCGPAEMIPGPFFFGDVPMSEIRKFALATRKVPTPAAAPRSATPPSIVPVETSLLNVPDPIAAVIDQVEAQLPRLLTPQEVAAMLGLTERTLERWRITGEGPRYSKLSRSTVRYLREDVAAFVADRLRANTAQ
jgi:predicted DNA-binding transcriptional regulator AlpA